MNPRILLIVENGRIVSALADGAVTVLIHNADEMDPLVQIPVDTIERGHFSRTLENAHRGALVAADSEREDACPTPPHETARPLLVR